ncbi:MAG: carbohydrate binding family 9 domain-containing protein, partial [Vicinamibacteria bacterium]
MTPRLAPISAFWMIAAGGAAYARETPAIDYETARFERRLVAKRATGPIAIDANFSEADWEAAPVATDFIQNDPNEGEPATFTTEVRVLYDESNLYFGMVAHDDEPHKIIVNDITRDFNTRSGDVFGLVLDTFHDERNGFMFETNPAGAMFDAQFVNEGQDFNQNWDGVWFVKSRVTDEGWAAEMAIPLKTVRFQDVDPQTWGLNFIRRTRRLNEDSYWAPLPRIHRFTRLSLAGTLEDLRGLRSHRDIKVTPYGKGDVSKSADLSTDGEFDAGVDAKVGIGSSLRMD